MSERSKQYITTRWLGISRKELIELSSMSQSLNKEILLDIFGLNDEELLEVYSQCGVVKPYVNMASMDSFYTVMLWLYVTGRCKFSLNAYCKIEWLQSDRNKRIDMTPDSLNLNAMAHRLRALMGRPVSDLWLLLHLAKVVATGMPKERRSVLSSIFMNIRNTIVRTDYKAIDKYFDLNKILYRGRRVLFGKTQFHCMMDRLRIEACHIHKGSKEDLIYIMRGSTTRTESLRGSIKIPIPLVDDDDDISRVFRRSLKLMTYK